jgi:uncharacterized protein (TIGR02118 family)
MIKVTVLYPNHPNSKFDWAYYSDTHIPMVRQKLGAALKGVSVDMGVGGTAPGSPPPYVALIHLLFESVESFQSSFGPHAQAIEADVPRYTNIEPVIQISEVRL